MSGTNGDFDADGALWIPGVDYVGGWRDAVVAGAELVLALAATCPDVEGVTAVAQSAPDGSGAVSVRLPLPAAGALTRLLRAAYEEHGDTDSARTSGPRRETC